MLPPNPHGSPDAFIKAMTKQNTKQMPTIWKKSHKANADDKIHRMFVAQKNED